VHGNNPARNGFRFSSVTGMWSSPQVNFGQKKAGEPSKEITGFRLSGQLAFLKLL
jgi:hypothetical protein